MTLLHCTQKILKEIGSPSLWNSDEPSRGLDNWYANLLTIDIIPVAIQDLNRWVRIYKRLKQRKDGCWTIHYEET